MIGVVLDRSQTIFNSEIFKNRFLDDPENLSFPLLKDNKGITH